MVVDVWLLFGFMLMHYNKLSKNCSRMYVYPKILGNVI